MPTEVECPLADSTPTCSRDTPPHLVDDPISKAVRFELIETLRAIEEPHDDIPEDVKIFELETKELPGLFAPHHCIELEAKIRIMGALKFGHEYLRQPTIKKRFELTRLDFKRPLLVKTLEAMEETIRKFRILNQNKEFLGAAPEPEKLARTTKLLIQIRRDYQYDLLADGLAIPVLPVWGKDNNPHQWWSINDYEILCAVYRQAVELFLKSFLPYLLKGEKEVDPTTPQKLKPYLLSISEVPAPKKPRKVSFLQAPPISSITSSTRLGAMVKATSSTPRESTQEWNLPQQPWGTPVKDSDDPFNTPDASEEEISTYHRPKGPPKPPGDSSDSDKSGSNSKPFKIPL